MHPLHRYITRCNNADPTHFAPLSINGVGVGMVHQNLRPHLAGLNELEQKDGGFILRPSQNTVEACGQALRKILHHLIAEGVVRKERFELYSVAPEYGVAPLALADRALMPALGFPATGIHCNAYVRKPDGLYLWIARRALNSAVDPGKLDHLVAGGQPHGLSLMDNLAKEAWEEAAIPPELAAQAVPVGSIRYMKEEAKGVRRDMLFVFDLELPAGFSPKSNDGESFDFQLMPAGEVKERLITNDDFKFNVPLVMIDFLIRHSLIDPEEPGYALLAASLHHGNAFCPHQKL